MQLFTLEMNAWNGSTVGTREETGGGERREKNTNYKETKTGSNADAANHRQEKDANDLKYTHKITFSVWKATLIDTCTKYMY